jgi:uncharacterized protein DUF3592
MILSRASLFVICFVAVVTPFLVPKIIWLAGSEKTNGIMRFVGKSYTGQLIHFYSEISFIAGRDTIWFDSEDNTIFEVGETVPVRYRRNNPSDAKVNIFTNTWNDTLIYGTGPLVILLLVFFHPKGIPKHSRFSFGMKAPFIKRV